MGAVVLTNLPGLQTRTGIGDTEVSLVVLGVLLAAAAGSMLAEPLARRWGSAWVLTPAFALQAAGVLAAVVNLPYWALFPVYAVFGLGVGLGDAGNGMQGLAVQREYGKSILATLFACTTGAAIVGALLVSAVNGSSLPFEASFVIAAVVALGTLAVARRNLLATAPAPAASVPTALPRRGIWVYGLVIAVVFLGDGVASTWSSVFLDSTLHASAAVVPLAYAFYQGASLVARLAGDAVIRRIGRATVLVTATLGAVAGLAVVVVSTTPLMAIAGFAMTGLGLGVVVPVSFSAAGDLAPEHTEEIVARLNLFNYAGMLVGSAATGIVADATSLRVAIAIPAVMLLGVLAAARSYRTAAAARV